MHALRYEGPRTVRFGQQAMVRSGAYPLVSTLQVGETRQPQLRSSWAYFALHRYHNVRIDTVHYCDREADLSAQRKRGSFISRNPPQERLHLFCRSVRENAFLASQVQYLKTPYMTRETCKADLARTVSVLPNLRYVDLPDGFYNDDPSSNTLRQELQARCGEVRQMKYARGAEGSFQYLAQARQWQNLEALELLHLATDPATILDVFTSLKSLRHVKLTSLQSLDDSVFGSMRTSTSRFPPMAGLELRNAPHLSSKGLLAYLSYPEVKQALKSLTLVDTGILPSDHFQILAAATSLTAFHAADSVSGAMPHSQSPLLASCSLRVLHYEISGADSSPRGLSVPSDSYYSYLSRSILAGCLPSLSQLYGLSTSLPIMLLGSPQPAFAAEGDNDQHWPVNDVVPRPLHLYSKAVPEMEWNLTLITPPTSADHRGSATTTRPMSLYSENRVSLNWRDRGRESMMVGNGFGGFLAVPSEDPDSIRSKLKKGKKDVDAWMG